MHNSDLIQQILTSPEGKKALEFISPIYDNSYHALWYLQSIGLQLDDMQSWVEDLWLQVSPQTATWGLMYWEAEYGIPTNPELPILERRNTLLATVRQRAPMNPWRIASIASAACGLSCRVDENTDINTFDIYISALGSIGIDEDAIKRAIRRAKPAHLVARIKYEQGVQSSFYPAFVSQKAVIVTGRQVN